MPRTVVISQPMFIPWVGLFEQVRLAEIFMHYDDVQLPQGRSFMTRVQIKTANGIAWLTAPIDRNNSGKLISETMFATNEDWRDRHLKTIRHAYARAPHFEEMIALAENIYEEPSDNLAEFNMRTLEKVAHWLGFQTEFRRSSDSGIGGASTQRLVDLCRLLGADRYVTGLGALKYLDHAAFENEGMKVEYMKYEVRPYPQLHGEFTPYVSILDAVANCGRGLVEIMGSTTIDWRKAVQ